MEEYKQKFIMAVQHNFWHTRTNIALIPQINSLHTFKQN